MSKNGIGYAKILGQYSTTKGILSSYIKEKKNYTYVNNNINTSISVQNVFVCGLYPMPQNFVSVDVDKPAVRAVSVS
jgi:hypothetical protein